jgi:hypothetical protein
MFDSVMTTAVSVSPLLLVAAVPLSSPPQPDNAMQNAVAKGKV